MIFFGVNKYFNISYLKNAFRIYYDSLAKIKILYKEA